MSFLLEPIEEPVPTADHLSRTDVGLRPTNRWSTASMATAVSLLWQVT